MGQMCIKYYRIFFKPGQIFMLLQELGAMFLKSLIAPKSDHDPLALGLKGSL